MKQVLSLAALLLGQMNTLQDKPIVHLRPNEPQIQSSFGGKLLELVNAPARLSLPAHPPQPDSQGLTWEIDIKNLGPALVTVVGPSHFSVPVQPGRTVHVRAAGVGYALQN